jgi:hypothetical protein
MGLKKPFYCTFLRRKEGRNEFTEILTTDDCDDFSLAVPGWMRGSYHNNYTCSTITYPN